MRLASLSKAKYLAETRAVAARTTGLVVLPSSDESAIGGCSYVAFLVDLIVTATMMRAYSFHDRSVFVANELIGMIR